MIALKHAIRLKSLFPEMKVTICYLEMRTAGVGYENWFLDARRAGVEFRAARRRRYSSTQPAVR